MTQEQKQEFTRRISQENHTGLILVLYWLVPYIYDLFESIKELFSL